jgi:tetratricopeptide (TPR) repeat protein
MTESHISADLLRRFLGGRAAKDEAKRVVRHLIRGCKECKALSARLVAEAGYWFPQRTPVRRDETYAAAFEAAFSFATEEERRAAVLRLRGWGQWASIEPLQPGERMAEVMTDRSFHHWGFYRALLDASRWRCRSHACEAVSLVELALAVSQLLESRAVGGEEAATDLRAKGFAILGNARRMASDLDGAREALAEAWRLNRGGTGDPLERAQLICFEASYSRMMGEFETAETALAGAARIYAAAGDRHLQGRVLIQMGDAIGYQNPDRAVLHLTRALDLIDTAREPRLELCAQHDLAHFLSDSGKPMQALVVLDRARPLYKQFPDDWTQLRLHWLEGRIARALGHPHDAVHIFRQVWEAFRERGLHYDLVMVSIDLAEAYVAEGNPATAARLASEVHSIMEAWGVHRYALAAWLMLQQAVEAGQADALFAKIRLHFRRRWHNPAELSAS